MSITRGQKTLSIELNSPDFLTDGFKDKNVPFYNSDSWLTGILKKEYECVLIKICPPCNLSLTLKLWVEDDVIDLMQLYEANVEQRNVLDWVVGGLANDGYVVYRAERQGGGDVTVELSVLRVNGADIEAKYCWKVDADVLDGFWSAIARELVSAAQQIQISRE